MNLNLKADELLDVLKRELKRYRGTDIIVSEHVEFQRDPSWNPDEQKRDTDSSDHEITIEAE